MPGVHASPPACGPCTISRPDFCSRGTYAAIAGGADPAGALGGAQRWLRQASSPQLAGELHQSGLLNRPWSPDADLSWELEHLGLPIPEPGALNIPFAHPYYWAAFVCSESGAHAHARCGMRGTLAAPTTIGEARGLHDLEVMADAAHQLVIDRQTRPIYPARLLESSPRTRTAGAWRESNWTTAAGKNNTFFLAMAHFFCCCIYSFSSCASVA